MVHWFFFDYRKRIAQQYSSLFATTDADEDDGYLPVASGIEKYGWYHILQMIAERDITKFGQILDINMNNILTHIAYLRDYASVQKQAMKKANR